MTKKMRIKDIGATINLGNYSSLHVTIGEPSEFAGLSFDAATTYLRNIAEKVGGVLNLPENLAKKTATTQKEQKVQETAPVLGEKVYCFGNTTPIWYDHASHTYTNEKGVAYESVTQLLSTYYPFNSDGKIKQEYMDFAASFGNLVHTAIQNAVIGRPPKKEIVAKIVEDVLASMGEYDEAFVERTIALPEQEVAGRFDILTRKEDKYTLWDVKTNTDLTLKVDCLLPEALVKKYSDFWAVDTTYGEHCLQLNLYAYIIEATTDIKIDDIKIIHVPDSFERIWPVPRADVSDLLSAYGSIR